MDRVVAAKLALHEVMAERFVRLLRLDAAADATTAAALRDALPAELWPIGVALLCERGMAPAHQKWFAAFVNRSHRGRPCNLAVRDRATSEFLGCYELYDIDPAGASAHLGWWLGARARGRGLHVPRRASGRPQLRRLPGEFVRRREPVRGEGGTSPPSPSVLSLRYDF